MGTVTASAVAQAVAALGKGPRLIPPGGLARVAPLMAAPASAGTTQAVKA